MLPTNIAKTGTAPDLITADKQDTIVNEGKITSSSFEDLMSLVLNQERLIH